jgi:hypothetical protein
MAHKKKKKIVAHIILNPKKKSYTLKKYSTSIMMIENIASYYNFTILKVKKKIRCIDLLLLLLLLLITTKQQLLQIDRKKPSLNVCHYLKEKNRFDPPTPLSCLDFNFQFCQFVNIFFDQTC